MAPLTDRELDDLAVQPDAPACVSVLIRDLRQARRDRDVLIDLLADALARLAVGLSLR